MEYQLAECDPTVHARSPTPVFPFSHAGNKGSTSLRSTSFFRNRRRFSGLNLPHEGICGTVGAMLYSRLCPTTLPRRTP